MECKCIHRSQPILLTYQIKRFGRHKLEDSRRQEHLLRAHSTCYTRIWTKYSTSVLPRNWCKVRSNLICDFCALILMFDSVSGITCAQHHFASGIQIGVKAPSCELSLASYYGYQNCPSKSYLCLTATKGPPSKGGPESSITNISYIREWSPSLRLLDLRISR
jgi:hypothetical protein